MDEPKNITGWKFVWNDSGKFFSSYSKRTIESYAKGAFQSFGDDCGRIEPVYDEEPCITEGKE